MALGAFVACTPFVGLHLGIAFVLATLLRQNRVWAMIGSRLSSTPIFLAITFGEIEIAHRLRTGAWVALGWHDAAARGRELLTDWLLGTVLLGMPIAALTGLLAFLAATRWHRVSSRRLAAPRPPSSEFPP